MTEQWCKELKIWAEQIAAETAEKPGVLGTAIGGSLARGQEWQHSDLELGILMEQKNPAMPYFNIVAGRGVEMIQLDRSELEAQVQQVEGGDLSPVAQWPIQLWTCRVMHDSTGLLTRMQALFDRYLFDPSVVAIKTAGLRKHIDDTLQDARTMLAQNRPAAALTRVRYAANEAILALHWHYGELPRSQNRTDSRLRRLCKKYNNPAFYALYRQVFGLGADSRAVARVIRSTWLKVRPQVLEITRLWGDSARDFFLYAVDGDFAWGQNAGILTVYRLYIPIIGGEQGIFNRLDDDAWAKDNDVLLRFLGLERVDAPMVTALIDRLAEESAKTG